MRLLAPPEITYELPSKYAHSLEEIAHHHSRLFDELATQRDTEYLQLLDRYEDAVRSMNHMQSKLRELEPLQHRFRSIVEELQATKDRLQGAQHRCDVLEQQLRQTPAPTSTPAPAPIPKDTPKPTNFDGLDAIWVCFVPYAGKLLLDPNFPDSFLSSSSAGKVATFYNGVYQQVMRQTNLPGASAEVRQRDEKQMAEIHQLRTQVAKLRQKLANARSRSEEPRPIHVPAPARPSPAHPRTPEDAAMPEFVMQLQDEVARLRAELDHRDAVLQAQDKELAQMDRWKSEAQKYQEWLAPKAPGASQRARGRRHFQPTANSKEEEWEAPVHHAKPTTPAAQLYCISEYGRIVRDNAEMDRRVEQGREQRPHPRTASPPRGESQWSKWNRTWNE